MEKCEDIFEDREIKEIDLCKKAIETYWQGYYEYSEIELSEGVQHDILTKSFYDAEGLAKEKEGKRYGAPGWEHAKLVYGIPPGKEEKHFFVSSNGMEKDKFQKWQSFIGEKFEGNDLKFFYFERNEKQTCLFSEQSEENKVLRSRFLLLSEAKEQGSSNGFYF